MPRHNVKYLLSPPTHLHKPSDCQSHQVQGTFVSMGMSRLRDTARQCGLNIVCEDTKAIEEMCASEDTCHHPQLISVDQSN